MSYLPTAISSVMALVLIGAGLEKARDRSATTSTLERLGAPRAVAWHAAGLLGATEVAVALGLVFRPDSAWTQAGVVVLAVGFALAGVLALLEDEPIRCNCFGSSGQGTLGTHQVVALLPWLGGVALVHGGTQGPPSLEAGAARLAAVGLALAAWRGIALVSAWRAARDDRRSAREMLVWLR